MIGYDISRVMWKDESNECPTRTVQREAFVLIDWHWPLGHHRSCCMLQSQAQLLQRRMIA